MRFPRHVSHPTTPTCRHCGTPTQVCPLGDQCPGHRLGGMPGPCGCCAYHFACPVHGRHWIGTL